MATSASTGLAISRFKSILTYFKNKINWFFGKLSLGKSQRRTAPSPLVLTNNTKVIDATAIISCQATSRNIPTLKENIPAQLEIDTEDTFARYGENAPRAQEIIQKLNNITHLKIEEDQRTEKKIETYHKELNELKSLKNIIDADPEENAHKIEQALINDAMTEHELDMLLNNMNPEGIATKIEKITQALNSIMEFKNVTEAVTAQQTRECRTKLAMLEPLQNTIDTNPEEMRAQYGPHAEFAMDLILKSLGDELQEDGIGNLQVTIDSDTRKKLHRLKALNAISNGDCGDLNTDSKIDTELSAAILYFHLERQPTAQVPAPYEEYDYTDSFGKFSDLATNIMGSYNITRDLDMLKDSDLAKTKEEEISKMLAALYHLHQLGCELGVLENVDPSLYNTIEPYQKEINELERNTANKLNGTGNEELETAESIPIDPSTNKEDPPFDESEFEKKFNALKNKR